MDDSVVAMRVETLQYRSIPAQSAWPGLLKALAVATLFSGVAMFISSLTILRYRGYFGHPLTTPSQVAVRLPDLVLHFTTIGFAIALVVSAVAVLSNAKWTLAALRIIVSIQLVRLIVFAIAMTFISIEFASTSTDRELAFFATASSFSQLMWQSGVPILSLVIFRLYRRSSQT